MLETQGRALKFDFKFELVLVQYIYFVFKSSLKKLYNSSKPAIALEKEDALKDCKSSNPSPTPTE